MLCRPAAARSLFQTDGNHQKFGVVEQRLTTRLPERFLLTGPTYRQS